MWQSVVITNYPSSIDQNQQLLVRFPNLGKDDVIFRGTARLAFTITLDSAKVNRTWAAPSCRSRPSKIAATKRCPLTTLMSSTLKVISGRQLRRGQTVIIRGLMPLITKTQQGFESVPEKEIQALPLTRPPLMLSVIAFSSHSTSSCSRATCHFYQGALVDQLEYELTFNDYNRVIQAVGDADAAYHIGGISLEYDIVTHSELARMIDNQYKGRLTILYDRVLRHRKMTMDKSNTIWNINLNVPARSMKGILMLFKNVATQQPFARNIEVFYNP